MICATCGFPLAAAGGFCSKCGNRIMMPATAPAYAAVPCYPRVQQHIDRLGILWAVFAVYRAITAVVGMFFAKAFFSGFAPFGWRAHHMPFMHLMHFGVTMVFLMAAGYALVAYGLMHRQRWARPLAMVFAVLALFKFPFGTALGIYTLWVLALAVSAAEYDAIAEA